MAGRPKPSSRQAFDSNMADARFLLRTAEGISNYRTRRARSELRARVGDALRIPTKHHTEIECVESDDLFIVIKPGSSLVRADFADPRPLLRQSIVAACAATETFLNDLVMENIGTLLSSSAASTARLSKIPMNIGMWLEIEDKYKRRRRGLRELVVKEFVQETASTSPTKVGELMSMLGVVDWAKKVDAARKVPPGDTVEFLQRVTDRRNRIAHQGDRKGRGQANISATEVDSDLIDLISVVNAMEAVVK